MWLLLHLLMVGFFCRSFSVEQMRVLLGNMATLKCPNKTGDVSWSRNNNGNQVELGKSENGLEFRKDGFGMQADNSLVIVRVKVSDSAIYLCNGKPAVDLKVVDEIISPSPVTWTLTTDRRPSVPDPGQQWSTELWRVLVGVGGGLVLVLLLVLTPVIWFKRKQKTERVYEEIQVGKLQPPQQGECSNTEVIYTTNNEHVYETVTMDEDQCVYSLAQNPPDRE